MVRNEIVEARFCLFGNSEIIGLANRSEPAYRGTRKPLFTCAIYSNKNHTKTNIHTYTNLQIKISNVRFYVQLNNWHPKH